MRDSMSHGGPDDCGIYIDDTLPLALGHRRLSLIDLSSAGHQPMCDLDDQLQLIFNGEIYNYRQLKTELEALGHRFKTKTDTEVILKAYIQWNTQCFQRFNGMFALAIFNKQSSEIILARDHAGIKPLYYHLSANKLVFASEIRAFKALDEKWLENPDWKVAFLSFGHLPAPITTLMNVQPLQKGTAAIISLHTMQVQFQTFNTFCFSGEVNNLPGATALIKEKLQNAVARHLISDAPIGVFLSGGIDSSLITLLAHRTVGDNLKTLSIVFEDTAFNEASYQQLIADKINARHHSFLVTEKEFGEQLPDILLAMDQPSTDGINSYFICKYAKKYGLTAVLSGLGADELFGGYQSFNRTGMSDFLQRQPSFIPGLANSARSEKYKKIAFLKRKDLVGQYLFNRGFYGSNQVSEMLGVSPKEVEGVLDKVITGVLPVNTHPQNRLSFIETNLYMQNQLLKDTDYMSMWHSVEVRVPFLDKELMQAVYSIDPAIRFDKKLLKHLLIKAFNDILPAEIWQRKKMGFSFPFNTWMNQIQSSLQSKNYLSARKRFVEKKINWSRYWASLLSEPQNKIVYCGGDASSLGMTNEQCHSDEGGIPKRV